MKKINHIRFSYKVCWFTIIAFLLIQSVLSQQRNDSLWNTWNQTHLADTIRLKAIDEFIEATVRNRPDSGLILAEQMLDFALKKNNKKYQAGAHFLKGRSLSYTSDYKKSLFSYEKSIALYTEIEDLKGKAKAMAYVAGLYDYQLKYDLAIDYSLQVLSIANKIGDIERIAGVSKVLGHSLMKTGAYERAIDVFQNGLRDAEQVNDLISQAYFLIAIGELYIEQRDEKKALDYLNKALDISEAINDKMSIAAVYKARGINDLYNKNFFPALENLNRGLTLFEETKNQSSIGQALFNIGQVYEGKGDFDLALSYFDRAKQIAIETSIQDYYTDLLIHEGTVKIQQGKIREAIKLCDESYNIAKSSNMLMQEQNACECLFQANKLLNNTSEALFYHEKMTSIIRRLQLQKTSKNLQNLEYTRTRLKDSIIKVEQKRLEELRIAKIEAETQRRHGLQYTGILLVVIILFLLIFISGKISLKPKLAKGLIFFAFLLFFEFLLVLVSPSVSSITSGEPALVLICNAILALVIIPIHTFFEKTIKKKVSK